MIYQVTYQVLSNDLTCEVNTRERTICFDFCNCTYKILVKDGINMYDKMQISDYINVLTLKVVYRFAFSKQYKLKRKTSPMS